MWCRPPSSISVLLSVIQRLWYEGTYPVAYAPGRDLLHPVLVVKEINVERGEQRRCEVLEIQPGVYVPFARRGPQQSEDGRAAPVVGGVREALQTVGPAQRFVAAVEQIQVLGGEAHEPVQEGVELLDGRGSWFPQDFQRLLLEKHRRLVEERLAQKPLVRKAPVERTLPDTRGPGYLFHRDARDAALLEEPARRTEDHTPVARRVAPLRLPARRTPQMIQPPPCPCPLHD